MPEGESAGELSPRDLQGSENRSAEPGPQIEADDWSAQSERIQQLLKGEMPDNRNGRIQWIIDLSRVQVRFPPRAYMFHQPKNRREEEAMRNKEIKLRSRLSSLLDDELATEIVKQRTAIEQERARLTSKIGLATP